MHFKKSVLKNHLLYSIITLMAIRHCLITHNVILIILLAGGIRKKSGLKS